MAGRKPVSTEGLSEEEAKEAVKLLELLMRSAGTLDGSTAGPTVNVQNNVGIALPIPKGINKLKHLDAT